MARILAISSQVARGHVGLSAIVPALQALGHEVIALPTILLSNHPGHQTFASERVSPDLIARMLDALGANGWLGGVDAVLTGYMPSAGHVALISEAIGQLRELNPGLVYLCDPVIGDEPKGVYIAPEAAVAIRDLLLPQADAARLNRFELAWMSAETVSNAGDAASIAARMKIKLMLATSLPALNSDAIENALIVGGAIAGTVSVPRHAKVPNGTGDLMSALWLAHLLNPLSSAEDAFNRAVAGVRIAVEASIGKDELQLIPHLRAIAAGDPRDAGKP